MKRRALHVLNVAGIMLSGRDDSLERWIRKDLAPATLETFAPIPASRVLEGPAAAIRRTGERVDAFLRDVAARDPEGWVVGVGRSFGGYMLLRAVSEDPRRLDRFALLAAIESPLRPEVPVSIPPLLPVLLPAVRHYTERPRLAREMVSALRGLDLARVLTAGGAEDAVIAPASMSLPGVRHVVLPPLEPGFAPETAILPAAYRRHLTWGEEKHRLVNRVLADALAQPPVPA